MRVGISGSEVGETGEPNQVVEHALAAERHGFDFFGFGDTQAILRESYTTLSAVAVKTDSIAIGPMITNPVTRHPLVTASAICTLCELSDGRAFLGAGTGDSAVYTVGKTPVRLSELESFVKLVRSVARGESYEWEGTQVSLNWIDPDEPLEVPISLAADGPKSQRMAGMVADRVVFGTGLTPDVLQAQVENIDRGARAAGRDPADVEKWAMARVNVDDDRERAVGKLKSTLAGAAHHSLRHTLENKQVPEEHVPALQKLMDGYDPQAHVSPGSSPNSKLADELGLTEFLVDRYAIAGPTAECATKFRMIRDLDLVDGVYCLTPTDRTAAVIERVGGSILPDI